MRAITIIASIGLNERFQICSWREKMLYWGQADAISLLIRVIKGHLTIVEVLLLMSTNKIGLLIQSAQMSLVMRR